jgi:hypothetical protein
MDLTKILNSAFVAWGLAGLLMLMLAMLAFLRNRQLVKERVAILVIVMVMLLALIALSLGPQ